MRRHHSHTQLAILIAITSATARLEGQDPTVTNSGMPIEISAVPSKTLPGSPVTLEGTTGWMGDKSVVTIRVTLPDNKAAAPVVVPAKQDGAFSATFTTTSTLGTYQVTATAPDGKGTAKTTFAVVGGGAIVAEVTSRMQGLLDGARKLVARAGQELDALPISPPRDQARAKVKAIEQQLTQAPARIATVKKAMDQAFDARPKIQGPLPEWDQYLGELGRWQQQALTAQERLEQEAASSTQAAEGCAQLQQIADALAAASEILSIVQVPMDKSIGYWSDKVANGIASRTLDPATAGNREKYIVVQTMKGAAAILQGPKAWITAAAGAVMDAGQFLVNEAFDAYCVKFEGPIKGTFLGEAITRKGEKFWSYTIGLSGRIVLMYPKNGPAGQVVALQGFIEGAGGFALRSNPAPINRLVVGTVLFHKAAVAPPTTPSTPRYASELGSGMGGFAPQSFRIPITGILAKDSIVLTVLPATFDFSDVIHGRLVWVIVPMGSWLPEVLDVPVHFQKAQPIFERVIRRHPVLKVTTEGSFMVARGEFARDTTNADRTAHVTTQLTIKACNPGCVPLPVSPASAKTPK